MAIGSIFLTVSQMTAVPLDPLRFKLYISDSRLASSSRFSTRADSLDTSVVMNPAISLIVSLSFQALLPEFLGKPFDYM